MILSFGWTWPAFVARAKTVTRRDWHFNYAFRWHVGRAFDAYDRSPRFGGRLIGRGQLLARPHLQPVRDMPDVDYVNEGFEWMCLHPDVIPRSGRAMFGNCSRAVFNAWRGGGEVLYVVRFEIISIEPAASERLKRLLKEAGNLPAYIGCGTGKEVCHA